jgi:predicted Zn-dependent peptidase
VTAEELTKAKNTYRAQFIGARETTLSKAEALHHYLYFHDDIAEVNTELDAVLAVTAADLKRVATTYLAPANSVVMIVKPAPSQGGGQ